MHNVNPKGIYPFVDAVSERSYLGRLGLTTSVYPNNTCQLVEEVLMDQEELLLVQCMSRGNS